MFEHKLKQRGNTVDKGVFLVQIQAGEWPRVGFEASNTGGGMSSSTVFKESCAINNLLFSFFKPESEYFASSV